MFPFSHSFVFGDYMLYYLDCSLKGGLLLCLFHVFQRSALIGPCLLPASSRSFGTLQDRKRLDIPLNQPSQYFSALDRSILQLYTLHGWNTHAHRLRSVVCHALFVQLHTEGSKVNTFEICVYVTNSWISVMEAHSTT